MESVGKMKHRHKAELRELEKEIKGLAKKLRMTKGEARAKAADMRDELQERHAKELAAAEEAAAAGAGDAGDEAGAGAAAGADGDAGATAAVAAGAGAGGAGAGGGGGDADGGVGGGGGRRKKKKKSKAQRRRERREKEEADREARIAAEAATAVDYRQVEIDAITAQLKALGLGIKQVTADGHCLYRAVARQMELRGEPIEAADAVAYLRSAVAQHLRDNSADYMVWMEFQASDNAESDPEGAVDAYCKRLESTAVWGGQLETNVLAKVLHRPIFVYQAAGPVQKMGEEEAAGVEAPDDEPLRVSFHTHYYSLGDHYNSVEPVA